MTRPRTELSLEEVARLVALWRLSTGTAHAINNALTAILGEASYLRDERKADPEVTTACESIMLEVDRCARLTRALLARRRATVAPASAGAVEADLGRLLCELQEILPDALGRRYTLRVEPCRDLVVVPGPVATLELLVLGIVQSACSLAGETATLGLRASAIDEERATLLLRVEAPGLAEDAAERVRAPGSLEDLAQRTLLLATREAAARLEAKLVARGEAGRLEIEVTLPREE
ncbi:MAG: histidine kinase dimerization/phospho-acceptor domain-containing protein [Myxococcota bacterium]